MKNIILVFSAVILFAACGADEGDQPRTIPADQLSVDTPDSPFKGLGIRFNGYYREETQGVVYVIRFFPKGNAVLVNGTNDVGDQLPSLLTENAPGDPVSGWYNVPVTVRGDSLFFRTYPEKGEISYRGNVPSTSVVRLLRHSHINGTQAIKEYIFQPDQTSGQ